MEDTEEHLNKKRRLNEDSDEDYENEYVNLLQTDNSFKLFVDNFSNNISKNFLSSLCDWQLRVSNSDHRKFYWYHPQTNITSWINENELYNSYFYKKKIGKINDDMSDKYLEEKVYDSLEPQLSNLTNKLLIWQNFFKANNIENSESYINILFNKKVKLPFSIQTYLKIQRKLENLLKLKKLALIIPFRDLSSEQKRGNQLKVFHPYISAFLLNLNINSEEFSSRFSNLLKDNHTLTFDEFYEKITDENSKLNLKSNESSSPIHLIAPFKIFIIEQSFDNMKFNRGKLLNTGFFFSYFYHNYKLLNFHDIDLLPKNLLLFYYFYSNLKNKSLHLAKVWDRYNKNSMYYGGVILFYYKNFNKINGFPNNFWGKLKILFISIFSFVKFHFIIFRLGWRR